VGTFAVQIAKSFGADVTGVCSTRNVELIRSIGADHVIDYTREDFTQSGQRYDLILDNVGSHSLSEYRRVLKPKGTLVIVGGPTGDPWIGPLVQPIKAGILSPFVSQEFVMILAELNKEDLEVLSGLMRARKVTPVIDRRYRLSEAPAAIRYLEEGRARGKESSAWNRGYVATRVSAAVTLARCLDRSPRALAQCHGDGLRHTLASQGCCSRGNPVGR
jgi:NADPH:quinone reductase-like Zn-dependent oxidoreductase